MSNGKAFYGLDDMARSYQYSDQFQFLPWQTKKYWIFETQNI